jgi:hypothetical protein
MAESASRYTFETDCLSRPSDVRANGQGPTLEKDAPHTGADGWRGLAERGGDFLPPPPAEQATARPDQAGETCADDWARDPAYEAEIIFSLQHLTGRREMLIVRPEARLFRVSSSKVCVVGTWCRRVGAPLAPTCVRA